MNAMNPTKFADLLQRYRTGACTNEEIMLVEEWYNNRLKQPYLPLSGDDEALIGESIKSRIDKELEQIIEHNNTVPIWRKPRTWWVAAASVLALVSVTYLILRNRQPNETIVTNKTNAPVVIPGGNKALLTLADGSVIVLDSVANGQLATQGATMVLKKQDGQLVYNAGGNKPANDNITWNTISTPRGGQYQVVLPDGSRVWLNAASTLRFPTGFTGSERRVELTGEAYFEVAGLSLPSGTTAKKVPFIVDVLPAPHRAARGRVEVLGTHFNIMGYDDEHTINTTLLEGKVVFRSGAADQVLQPGQQTRLYMNGNIDLVEDADVEASIAWKNGLFQFNHADVQAVMRQIARWYDVTIEYQGKVPTEQFVGEIPRSSAITEVLKMLELSHVHFKIEGKKITVLP
jgi:transmembrane sensor